MYIILYIYIKYIKDDRKIIISKLTDKQTNQYQSIELFHPRYNARISSIDLPETVSALAKFPSENVAMNPITTPKTRVTLCFRTVSCFGTGVGSDKRGTRMIY